MIWRKKKLYDVVSGGVEGSGHYSFTTAVSEDRARRELKTAEKAPAGDR